MTSQPYAGAARHLVAAGRARLAIARGWDELHGEDGTGNTAVPRTAIMDNGAGLIRVVSSLTEQDLERLTSSFKLMIDELLSCLDSLVAESVTVFSAVLSERRPVGVEPYFPIAATQEDFEELLKEGHLFGVLRTQARMVMDCQPFKTAPGGEVVDACRRALGLLLDWSQRLEDGVQIDTWVTPVEPKVRVGEGGRVTDLEPCPAGLLGEARDVATFRIEGYQPGMRVDARAGSYIDLTYPDGIPPADEADTFGSRLKLVFEVVERFLGTFHALARQGPVQPGVLQAAAADKDIWTPALDAGRGWTEAEIQQIQDSDFGVGVVLDEGELTLVVTTPAGIFERRVPAAAPLADRKNHGTAAEDATHEAVATWGIPDFVIKPLSR